MKNFISFLLLFFLLSSCSTSRLVNEWKSPDTVDYQANKVLIIGMSKDKVLRKQFEEQLTSKLEKKGVFAVRSIDFFETSFIDEQKTEEDLNKLEEQLLGAGFDTILFTKITGYENKVSLIQAARNFDTSFLNFRDDYLNSQEQFYVNRQYESYTLYHAKTNLYCICVDKERELLWTGDIDFTEKDTRKGTIKDYIKTLITALDKNQLL